MPLPPPPAAALIITGKPISPARALASVTERPRFDPGTSGTRAASIAWRARVFDPINSIACAVGPMNLRPAPAQAWANRAFSERKPYPGWIAWAPLRRATSRIVVTLRYDSAAGAGPIGYASSAWVT